MSSSLNGEKSRNSVELDNLAQNKILDDDEKPIISHTHVKKVGWRNRKREVGREKSFLQKTKVKAEKVRKIMMAFSYWITSNSTFRTLTIVTLSINLILIAVFSNPGLIPRYGAIFELVDLVFLVIYTAEIILRVTAGPKRFWKGIYNRFDVFVLALSYWQVANLGPYGVGSKDFLRVFRAFRALRALRFISFVRDLQVLIIALFKTFKALAYVLLLLLLVLFVGASIAFQIYSPVKDPNNPYTNLLFGMLSLFDYVTADGWTNIQAILDGVLGISSRVVPVIILFFGTFYVRKFVGWSYDSLYDGSR